MIHIALVEDEARVQKLLKSYIEKHGEETQQKFRISVFSDGDEILEDYKPIYDIVFLDIQMKRIHGMEVAEKIREVDKNTILIFITNMAHYAIKGYSVDAMDFLLKPVSYFSFSEQLKKAVGKIQKNSDKYLAFTIDGGIIRLNIKEILYIESFRHKLTFHMIDAEYTINLTMKRMEEKLAEFSFFRCNNCYLVNLFYVEAVVHNIVMIDRNELQISRPKKKAFMKALTDYIGGEIK